MRSETYLVTQPIEKPVIASHNHQSIEKDLGTLLRVWVSES